MMFSVTLTKTAVVIMTLRKEVYLHATVFNCWLGHFIPFCIKIRKRDLVVEISRVVRFIKLSFKTLKILLPVSSSQKIGFGLLFFSKTYRSLVIREKATDTRLQV